MTLRLLLATRSHNPELPRRVRYCSGDSSSAPHETGAKTVLITATVGGVSRNVAVEVHIAYRLTQSED